VKPQRREAARRVTAELITFYTQRAHALRAEAYRDAVRALWRALVRIVGGRSSFRGARSASPESISPPIVRPDGFRARAKRRAPE
jgi:hypothetical protein